jgi:hypothetical protein
VFENWVLRRILEPKREEVVGGWRRLYNELHNLYTPPNDHSEDGRRILE